MAGTLEYLRWRGDLSFKERPFIVWMSLSSPPLFICPSTNLPKDTP